MRESRYLTAYTIMHLAGGAYRELPITVRIGP
jgi:hypothetical protein